MVFFPKCGFEISFAPICVSLGTC